MHKRSDSEDAPVRRRWLVPFGILLALACGLGGGLIAHALESNPKEAASNTTPESSTCPITKVAQDDLPSVVTISAKGAKSAGTGSGEVINGDGYILTNNHVISIAVDGGSVSVLFSNGNTADATIVGRDPLTDVAVIRVSGVSGLRPIPIGSSSSVTVGQQVIVLGAPLGLSSTVTSGIVSALDRTVDVPGETSQSALLVDALQTDAAINPGNSGGSLVNCAGQFIGMPSAGASVPTSGGESNGGSIGLGFAIPADLATAEASEIISTGHVTHAYFGFDVVPVSATASTVDGKAEGLLVSSVDSPGPAQTAGLRSGDVVTSIDGTALVSTDQVMALSLTKKPGQVVEIAYRRSGRSGTVQLILGQQPST